MSTTKKYWNSVEHLQSDPAFMEKAHNEFAQEVPVDEFIANSKLSETTTSRRDFLKFLGFSVSAATLAACETPVTKAIPYVVKPEEVTPGVANYYASTFFDNNDYCSILVKTREGRPIHIEGNKLSGVTKGGVNARVNSSVLSLYDGTRLKGPLASGQSATWDTVDADITAKIKQSFGAGKKVVLLTSTIISPSTQSLLAEISALNGGASSPSSAADAPAAPAAPSGAFQVVSYDPISASGILQANETSFGKKIIPSYHFDQAKAIVSIGADFLANWLSSIEYTTDYVVNRKPDGDWMSKHYQFETGLSLTGSNADVRVAVKASEHGSVAVSLYNAVAAKAGASTLSGGGVADDNQSIQAKINAAAESLWSNRGASLVVSGSNDKSVQVIVNGINHLLGNYGKTIDLNTPCKLKQGDDTKVADLVADMKAGNIGVLLIHGCDPAYSMPTEWGFAAAVAKVGTSVSFAIKEDSTSKLSAYVCPTNHFLESWDDANPKEGYYSVTQPVINKLFDTRQYQESLMKWFGISGNYADYMKSAWEKYGFPQQNKYLTFNEYWSRSLHDGVDEKSVAVADQPAFTGDLAAAAVKISAIKGGAWELELYSKVGIGDGSQAGNPWLQELPDPITKVVWDNYITMNPVDMAEGGYEIKIAQETPASMATVSANGFSVTLPVFPVPGQKRKTLGIALGYGKALVNGELIGQNAAPFTTFKDGNVTYSVLEVSIAKTTRNYPIASSQTHNTMMGRKIVNETDLVTFSTVDKNDPEKGWNKDVKLLDSYGVEKTTQELNLWDDHAIGQLHRWGMTIDLNTCTGCSACVTACGSENNIPVVGRDEVRRMRTMFWMRIDRYFSSAMNFERADKEDVGAISMYKQMEDPSEYPQVVFQPLMCQHCNHAPCETVCPVAATTHSLEGLNQMAYNRCVGTRYCANNCPYKVRRFNWFQYDRYDKFTGVNPSQDDYGRMVLNPDVVVRSRGVIEKCSMCVQRIQEGKLNAKKAGTRVVDGSIQTACSAACPTNAITFGDLADKDTSASAQMADKRAYFLIEEVGTQPNIIYLTKVRNVESQEA